MIILGVDPGSIITGYGLVETDGNRFQVLEAGPIRLKSAGEISMRLLLLATELEKHVREHKPDVVSLEKVFFGKNFHSALTLGYVRGVVLMLSARYNLPVAEYSPTEVKKAVCGYGKAEKGQVQEMVRMLLNLPQLPQPSDVADALALAICHAHMGPMRERFAGDSAAPAIAQRRVWRRP